MAKVKAPIAYGSRGDSVTELQKILNGNGYNLKEDGIFGKNTQSAVKDYQKKNALSVDGVVGNKTWGALSGSGNQAATTKPAAPSFSYDDYKESDTVTQAQAALNAQLMAKPGVYQSQWAAQIDDILGRIMNREEFSYDVNGDALYQQYKDNYIQQGKMAMQDTMGQAAAMTGGYGNSYAATAGNQAYQASLGELNNVIPELYQMALDKYTREGDELLDQYAILGDQENQDYAKYQDTYNQWLAERDNAYDRYDAERDYDYGRYADGRDFAYGEYQDEVAKDQWQKQFDITEEQWEMEKQAYLDSQEAAKVSTTSSGGGSSSGGSSGKGTSSGGSAGRGSTTNVTSGTSKTGGVSDSIRSKLEGIKSNDAAEKYLENLEASGAIDHETALQLMSEYLDVNEVYKDNDDGSRSISYGDMVKSTGGWKVVDNGGVNWFWGVDNNAIVEAPNGEQIRLDNLIDRLVSEGMSKSDAKNYVKKLQKNLKV